MNATHQERNDHHIFNHESTRTSLNSPGQTETNSNENDILFDDAELIPNNDNFLYNSKDEIKKESLKKSENNHAEKITNFSNVNSSAFRQVGTEGFFFKRVARNSGLPSNQQSFENTCLYENNNGFLKENRTNRLLSSTDQCVQDYSATGNYLNFDARKVNDVIIATMKPLEAHSGSYNIRNVFNQGNNESYSGRIGSFVTSQEQALDLSCRNNVNSKSQSKDTIVKNSVSFWSENTTKSDPLWDNNATASFKCPDNNLAPISTQVHSAMAPFDTISASLTYSLDQHKFPFERSTQTEVSKVCRPIPIYPQSINQSMPLGYNQFQCGTLAHQLASTPYNFHATCPYPASLYSPYYRSPSPWTTFNANNNNSDMMWNSCYDKGERYQLPFGYNSFDHNLMPYSLPVCSTTADSSSYFKDGCVSTMGANAAKMSHLFPFPGVDQFHTTQQDQLNHLNQNLHHHQRDESPSSQSRQSTLVSDYQNLSHSGSSQSLTTPSPFDFSCANKQMAQSRQKTTTSRNSKSSKITTYEQPNIRVNWPVKDKHDHSETYQRPWQTDEKCVTPQPDHNVSSRRLRECNADLSHRKDSKLNNSILLSIPTNKSDGRFENMSSKSNHVLKNTEINKINSRNISPNITWIENNRQRKERSINPKPTTSETNSSAKASVKQIQDRKLKRKLKQDTTDDNKKVSTENIQLTLMDRIPGNNLLTTEKINPNPKTNVTIISQERIKPLLGCSDFTSALNASNASHNGCIRNDDNGKNMPIVCEGDDTRGNLQQHSSVKQEVEYKNTDKGRYSSVNCKEYIGSHTLSSSVANQCLSDNAVKYRNDSATKEARSQTKIEDSRPTNSDNNRKQESKGIPCTQGTQAHCNWTMSQGLLPRKLSSNNMSASAFLDTSKAGMRNDMLHNSYTDQSSQGGHLVNYTSQTHHKQTHEAIACVPSIPGQETPVTTLSKLFNLTPSRCQQVPSTETRSTSPQNGTLKNTSSTMKNDETITSVDMNTVDANHLSHSKQCIKEDKPKAENNSDTASQFKCKECSSSHHSFSALLQHQSIGCQPKQSSGAAPVHATDCVGNYMRHDAKWVGDKCQCTPCPMCKGIFGSKFRVYTHIQRGCYKANIMRYKPDMFSVGGLEHGDMSNPTEACKFPYCGFRSEAKKCDGGANGDTISTTGLKPSPPQKSHIIYVPRPKHRTSKLHLAESITNGGKNKNDAKHVQENKRHPHSKPGRKFEPRVEMVTQGTGRAQFPPGNDVNTQFSPVENVTQILTMSSGATSSDISTTNAHGNIKKENLSTVYVQGSSILHHPPPVSTHLQLAVNHPNVVPFKRLPLKVSNNALNVATTRNHNASISTINSSKLEGASGALEVKAENMNFEFSSG